MSRYFKIRLMIVELVLRNLRVTHFSRWMPIARDRNVKETKIKHIEFRMCAPVNKDKIDLLKRD